MIEEMLEIIEKYKLRMPPTVFYELKADIVNYEPEECKAEDCISRKAVLDMAETIQTDDYSGNEILDVVFVEDIKDLPSDYPKSDKLEKIKQLVQEWDNNRFDVNKDPYFYKLKEILNDTD